MKKNGLIFFLILILFGCQTKEYQNIFKLSYKESSLLRFHVTNCSDTMNYTFCYNTCFPFGQTTQEVVFCKDSIYSFEIQINHPVNAFFYDSQGTQTIRFFSLPKDTIDIFFNADTSQKISESIEYKGRTKSISNYLTKGKLIVGPCPRKEDGIDFYNKNIDSLTQDRIKALIEFNKTEPLPDWYIKYEKISIDYTGANDKLNQFSQRLGFYNQYLPKPSGFVENLKVEIDNPDARFCMEYLSTLCSLHPDKYDTLLQQSKMNERIFFEYFCDNINTASNYLSNDTKQFFIGSRITGLLNTKSLVKLKSSSFRLGRIDSLIANVRPHFKDTSLYSILLSYKNEQILKIDKINNLGKGDKAPDFILKDINDKTVKLSDFEGRYVVINFWTTWCAPCIASIQKKNKLFNDYNKYGLTFLNVCLDYNKTQWKKIITDNHFQGIHVICKGEWKNILSKNYEINIVPHYTFIDKKGNIISNTIGNFTAFEDLLKEDLK